jgi:carbamoyl-phosphate synthase large subunit
MSSLGHPTDKRIWAVWEALRQGITIEDVAAASQFDLWFTTQIAGIVALEKEIVEYQSLKEIPDEALRIAKQSGFSDEHIAWLLLQSDLSMLEAQSDAPKITAMDVRAQRLSAGILPTYHVVDTCAAEFESYTPYLYSSYETESEAEPTDRDKVIILGSGPNRIGQGIEFDYCCVHAAFALREDGYEAIMINCNPETVSTDYDTSDRLYFEPLTLEHVLNIIDREQPIKGVVVQFGGQTPLKLAAALEDAGVPILGTSFDSIDIAEDRGRFCQLMDELGIPVPAHSMAQSYEEALEAAARIKYPVIVRPSYVLGGRAMAIVYDEASLGQYVQSALQAAPGQPILIDQYLEDAYEVDVDAIADGENVTVCGVMQHIEEAGIHSGDSACVLPPYKVSAYHLSHIREYTEQTGRTLEVSGLMNIQYAVKDDIVYSLEVNPRASRTVPYVSKATGYPLAKLATKVIMGSTLTDLDLDKEPVVGGFFVKEAVLPFKKFFGVDSRLGPEMRSTGEVMGHAKDFGHAFAKAQLAAGNSLPLAGTVFISVNDYDKSNALKIARDLARLGFKLVATQGTAEFCSRAGLEVGTIKKVSEGSPNVVDLISSGEVDLVINTPLGSEAYSDGSQLRMAAVHFGVPNTTTLSAAQAAVNGIQALRARALNVCSLQEYYRKNAASQL